MLSDIVERTNTIAFMKDLAFDLAWLEHYSLEQILKSCVATNTYLSGKDTSRSDIQQELLENPGFAEWYSKIYNEVSPHMIGTMCDVCRENGFDITKYTVQEIKATATLEFKGAEQRVSFLENFKSVNDTSTLIPNLNTCVDVPIHLTESQRKLLMDDAIYNFPIFRQMPFAEISAYIDRHPYIMDVMHLLYGKGVLCDIPLDCLAEESYDPLKAALNTMEKSEAESFVRYWIQGQVQSV